MKKANVRKIPDEVREGYITALSEKIADDLYGCDLKLGKLYVVMGRASNVTSVTVTNKGATVRLIDVMSDETLNVSF